MALQRARGDPLAGLSTLPGAERRNCRGGRCGKERPAEEGGGGPQGWRQGGTASLSSVAYVIEIVDFTKSNKSSDSKAFDQVIKCSAVADRIVGDKQVTPRFIADRTRMLTPKRRGLRFKKHYLIGHFTLALRFAKVSSG